MTLAPDNDRLKMCFFLSAPSPAVLPAEICAADCGGHGVCVGGTCRCEEGWMGAACDQRACHPRCAEHGTCRDGKCECSPGWNGEHCTIGMAGPGPGVCCGARAASVRMWELGTTSFHLATLWLASPSNN